MRRNILVPAFLSLALAVGTASSLAAQESRGLADALSELLRSGEAGDKPLRKVPFGQEEVQLSYAPLVRAVSPAVVNVYASQQVAVRSPFLDDPFFEQFFGRRQMPPRVKSSLGSGVIVDPSGFIVTNYHVIRDADEVKVAMPDGREFNSEILLRDESLDLAVLKIEGSE